MTLHVYAALAPSEAPRLKGIEGAAVQLVPAGPVALAVTEHETPPAATPDSLQAHARVGLAVGGVPFRFGGGPTTAEELRRQVASKAAELAAKLEAVGDCVEMVIHVPRQDDHSTGKAYLLAKKRSADELDALKATLRELVRDFRETPTDRLLCLVPRDQLGEFRQRTHGRDVSGPWPPSSFV